MLPPRKCGYIRLSKAAPSLKEQQAALRSVGLTDFSDEGPVFVDEPPRRRPKPGEDPLAQRRMAIVSIGPGDELVIASAARLGTSPSDVLAALVEIARRGGAVYDVEAGKPIRWHPDALDAIEFVQRAETGQRREVTTKMRAKKVAIGALGGAPVKLEGEALAEAKRLWADPAFSAAQVAEKAGVTERTLYRRLGERGTPRFGAKRSR